MRGTPCCDRVLKGDDVPGRPGCVPLTEYLPIGHRGMPVNQNQLTAALDRARAFANQDHASWIDGRSQPNSGAHTDLIDPSSEAVIGRSTGASEAQVDAAVEAASFIRKRKETENDWQIPK
jgi:hypothetical protein